MMGWLHLAVDVVDVGGYVLDVFYTTQVDISCVLMILDISGGSFSTTQVLLYVLFVVYCVCFFYLHGRQAGN